MLNCKIKDKIRITTSKILKIQIQTPMKWTKPLCKRYQLRKKKLRGNSTLLSKQIKSKCSLNGIMTNPKICSLIKHKIRSTKEKKIKMAYQMAKGWWHLLMEARMRDNSSMAKWKVMVHSPRKVSILTQESGKQVSNDSRNQL